MRRMLIYIMMVFGLFTIIIISKSSADRGRRILPCTIVDVKDDHPVIDTENSSVKIPYPDMSNSKLYKSLNNVSNK